MKPKTFRSFPRLLPLAALLMACGLAQAIEPPRVMFVSGIDVKPVLIDLQGKEIPAKKGQVIPPGYSVKVPEGATVQIMTDEKAIVAVRQNSLLKLEKLGDGGEPHKFKLDSGGLRVANSDKKPHKFEVDTPNAKIKFDKGDHEAFYLKEGNKVTGGRWGTFVRGFKEESVLTTKDGDTKISRTVVGYVPGMSKEGKTELIDRIKLGGNFTDPVGVVFGGGGIGQAVIGLNENQRLLSENSPTTTLSNPRGYAPPEIIKGTSLSGLSSTFTKIDPRIVTNLNPVRSPDPNNMRQIRVGTLPGGQVVAIDVRPQSIGVMSTDPGNTATFNSSNIARTPISSLPPVLQQTLPAISAACARGSCLSLQK